MVGIRQKEKNNERNECINERSTTKKLTNESEDGHGQFLMRVLKGGTSRISQPIFFFSESHFPVLKFHSHQQNVEKIPVLYAYHLFLLRIRKITASKYDPTKTQKFTRIYKDVLEITGSFQTVIKLSSSEFIAISPCHFTFLPFLPAGNLPSDL